MAWGFGLMYTKIQIESRFRNHMSLRVANGSLRWGSPSESCYDGMTILRWMNVVSLSNNQYLYY